jgi:hypothetical protein
MVDTLLTRESTAEEKKLSNDQNLDWLRFSTLLEICYEHYISDDSKNDLAGFCEIIVAISEDYVGQVYPILPINARNRMVGELVSKAVKHDRTGVPGKVPVSNKAVFRRLVAELVDRAHQDGHPKNKVSQTSMSTAFEVVADILERYGITNNGARYSPKTISNWCN